jgi:hypothetical protein
VLAMLEGGGVGKGEEGARSRRLAVDEPIQWHKLWWRRLERARASKERWGQFTPFSGFHLCLAERKTRR